MPTPPQTTTPRSVFHAIAGAIGITWSAMSFGAQPAGAASAAAPVARRPIDGLTVSVTLHLGKTADWVAVTDTAVWVGSTGPLAVHAVDPTTAQRLATVVLPGEPCAGLAVGFESLWVPLCGRPGGLARVDLRTHTLVATYPVGRVAAEGGVTTGAGSVWIVLRSNTLVRIDPANGTVQPAAHLPAGSFNPYFSEGRLWITRAKGAEVTAVDAATGTVLTHVATGPHPRFLTAGAGAVWTLNQGDGSLSRIDTSGSAPVQTIALGTPGPGGDITYGAGRIWTTFFNVPLSIIDATHPTLLCQWAGPGGDSVGFGHGALWLTNYRAGTLSRIALADMPTECTGAAPTQ